MEKRTHLHGLGGHEGDHLHNGPVGAALPECPQALCYGASCSHIHANILRTPRAILLQHLVHDGTIYVVLNNQINLDVWHSLSVP